MVIPCRYGLPPPAPLAVVPPAEEAPWSSASLPCLLRLPPRWPPRLLPLDERLPSPPAPKPLRLRLALLPSSYAAAADAADPIPLIRAPATPRRSSMRILRVVEYTLAGSERAESVADAPPPEEWEADDAADSEATERLDGLRRWAGEEDSGEATEGAALAREAGEAPMPNGGRGGRLRLLAGGGVRPAIPLSLSSSFLGMERELLCLAVLTAHELLAYTILYGSVSWVC